MLDILIYDLGHNILGPLFAGSVGGAITHLLSRKKSHRRFTMERAASDSRTDLLIHEKLAVLRHQLHAIRAYVVRFHNGEEFFGDKPFTRKSRTHEVAADGYISQRDRYQGMMISLVPDEIKLIVEDGPSFTFIKDLMPGTTFWSICVDGRTGAVARCAMKRNGKLVAAVGVDFDRDITEAPANMDLMVEASQRIEALLYVDR